MPEPVNNQPITNHYDFSSEPECVGPPNTDFPFSPLLPESSAPRCSAQLSPPVIELTAAHSLGPKLVAPECLDKAGEAAKAGGMVIATGAGLLASATVGPIVAFIGASMAFGAALAQYQNCEDDVAARAKSKAPPK